MKLVEKEPRNVLCAIVNRKLLPVKIHTFLSVGALVGVIPFIVIHAESLGISAGLVGVTNAIMLLCSVFLKFFMGSLADKYRAVKLLLFKVVLLQAVFHIAIYTCITPIVRRDIWQAHVEDSVEPFSKESEYRTVCNCSDAEPSICLREALDSYTLSPCAQNDASCCSLEVRNGQVSALYTWQFWVFFVLRICSGGLAAVTFSLSDTATYAILGDQKELYGRQRLWGTIAWGGLAPVIGIMNQYFSKGRTHNYGPGFYFNSIISLLDLVAVCFLDIPETSRASQNMLSDLFTLFRSKHVLFFVLGVFVQGTLMGPIWSYAFMYFKDMGAPQTLLGLQLTVQCFLGEVPVMFFSGWIITKLGFKHSMSLSVAGTVLRLGIYAFGSNPWMMLPAEILHGLSFGLFYSAMTLYANRIAPRGTEATVQGIVSGMFEGAGIAVGSVACGLLFDINKRRTMLYFTAYGLAFTIIQILVNWHLGDPPIVREDTPACPPKVRVEVPSQSECLLREGTISRTDTEASGDQMSVFEDPIV
ncbi:major facilitator superfamily domain-containing protein 6-B [Galendromus occidentalis]|uniref:Major facilitator superfamily domain-containing protein 6-B n=1 Tax=Galendromus occidentalis TaxID=34638 RepID=A0AAJ6VXN5_9ACAR|nr:major facilitator superfamily domain-containing protein 6-B [Galendromus occidentalis]